MKLITKKLSLSITAIIFASTLSITQAQQTATVDAATQSAIIPTGLVAGDTFRLIFITSNTLGGTAVSNITRANTHVQDRAAASTVTALQGFSSKFRALVSTATVNARDNTDTNTVNGGDTDAPIYWLGGDKVADRYADFYDDSWDSNSPRTENGVAPSSTIFQVYTGSISNGTLKINFGIDNTHTSTGNPQISGGEIDRPSNRNSANHRYYGISPIFTVTGVAPSSDSDLSNLVVAATGLTITPATFAAATTAYSGSVASTVESVAVTPTVSDSGASVTVNGTTATSGSASIVTLSGGLNAILVVVTAADGSTKTYTINITKARPVIAFTIDAITDASVSEGVAYTSSTPSISGDTPIGDITYTKSGNDADDFTINSSTGVVSMVARDYESPEDADTSNDYEITITATDDDGNTATQNWTVSVTNYLELGGVSINPALWVKADEGLTEASNVITGWTDQSPSAGVATPTGSPVLSSSFINFNPSVLFDQTDDYFEFTRSPVIKGRDNFTFIAVAGSNNTSNLAHQHLFGANHDNSVRIALRGGRIALHRTNVGDIILSDANQAIAQGDIGIVAISRSGSNGNDFATYQDGAEKTDTSADARYTFEESSTSVYIGRRGRSGERLNGQIAELVVFEDVLSADDLDKVQTHLAIKYGITLHSDVDYLNSSGASVFDNSGTYTNDIVGIAKDDTSVLDQRISKSKNSGAILTISTDATFTGVNSGHTGSLTDGQYLIIGNDGGATTTQSTETPGSTTNRLVREWKVENTESVGEINLKFDGLDDTYTLYTDADGDFSAGATEVGALNANGEIATSLLDGTYFTFTASTRTITINEISGGYVNDAEDESAVTISGTSTNIAAAQGISLTISDTDGTTGDVTSRALVVAGTGGATDTWTTGIDSAEMKGLAEGTITVTASYTGAADATQTFTYDTTAPGKPTIILLDGANQDADTTTNSLGLRAGNLESAVNIEKTLDGGTTWTDFASTLTTVFSTEHGVTYSTLADAQADGYDEGNNTVSIRQTDEAGNVSAVSDALTFTYDVTAPTLAAAIDDQRATVETDFTFQIPTGAFTDATALTYTSSGQSNGISFETDTWSGTGAGLTAGVVTITVTATDTAGNTQTDIFTITIAAAPDRTPPVLAAEIPDQTATVGTDFSFQIPTRTFTDANTLTYTSSGESNGISFATDTWSGTGAGLTAGTVTITVTATDVAGNITSDEFNIIITERGVLAITINPISGGYVNDTEDESPVTISGTSINIPTTENIRLMLTGLGSGRLATVGSDGTWSIDLPSLAIKGITEGIITVDAFHHQSNTKYATATFIYDRTAPVLATEIQDQTAPVGTDFTFQIPTGTFTDTNTLTYTSSGQGNGISFDTDTWSGAGTGLTEGELTITVTATDAAGNSATDEFTITIAQLTDLALSINAFLQGPYDAASTNIMSDGLRAASSIPTTSPYGDGATIESTVLDVVTGEESNAIVDWVQVSLHDPTNTSVVIVTVPALLQRNGNVVALGGSSALQIQGVAGDYKVSINHRNHIPVITDAAQSLSTTETAIDFTNDLTIVTGGSNAMAEVATGIYALFSGDVNGNNQVQVDDYNAAIQDVGRGGYLDSDVDMNGELQVSDINFVLKTLGKGAQF